MTHIDNRLQDFLKEMEMSGNFTLALAYTVLYDDESFGGVAPSQLLKYTKSGYGF